MKSFRFLTIGILAGVFAAGVAVAQLAPALNKLNNTAGGADYVQVVPGGASGTVNSYVTSGQVAATMQYKWGGTITTDPAYTFTNGVYLYSAHKASGLSTATLTTEPNPADGKRECYVLDQTTTTLTWTANTGQTIDSSVRASGVASVPTCIFYNAATATWYQGN